MSEVIPSTRMASSWFARVPRWYHSGGRKEFPSAFHFKGWISASSFISFLSAAEMDSLSRSNRNSESELSPLRQALRGFYEESVATPPLQSPWSSYSSSSCSSSGSSASVSSSSLVGRILALTGPMICRITLLCFFYITAIGLSLGRSGVRRNRRVRRMSR